MPPLLEVKGLTVSVPWQGKLRPIVHDANFTVGRGEVLVLVGQSGSGKSVLSRALTKLFAVGETVELQGSVVFEGRPVFDLKPEGLASLRRRRIRYIFQEPLRALNPVARIGSQMRLAADSAHPGGEDLAAALRRAGIEEPGRVLRSYPHQLSVGMAQRVLIAMALLPHPGLLIADEPTSAVDAPLRSQLLGLLLELQQSEQMAMLLITHDLEAARRSGGQVIVMLAGRVIEAGPAPLFFSGPLHPYARLMLEGTPALMEEAACGDGGFDAAGGEETGCAYAAQCPRAQGRCRTGIPPLTPFDSNRQVRCFF
ncbi:MAG TPA: ABC transporter ATP-binding protein [Bacteroidota bacterium]